MRIIKLTPSNREYIENLDMFSMMPLAELGSVYSFGLVAVMDDQDEETDIPAGLVLCTQRADTLIIWWLCIAENYRMQGVGEELLMAVANMAKDAGITYINAYFNNTYGREYICNGEKSYFKEHRFISEVKLPGEWHIDVKTLMKLPFFQGIKEPDKKTSGIYSLRNISASDIKAALFTISSSQQENMLYPVAGQKDRFNKDVSFLSFDKSRQIKGGLLVEEINGTLYPVCFFADSNETAKNLLSAGLSAASLNFEKDTPIHILLINNTFKELLSDILPDKAKLNNSFLIARTNDLSDYNESSAFSYDSFAELPSGRNRKINSTTLKDLYTDKDMLLTLTRMSHLSLLKNKEKPGNVLSLGSLNFKELSDAALDCFYYEHTGLLEQFGEQLSIDSFDMEISGCIKENGRATSFLLVYKTHDNCLVPILFFSYAAESKKHLLQLIKYSILTALDLLPSDTKVLLYRRDKATTDLIDRLFSNL